MKDGASGESSVDPTDIWAMGAFPTKYVLSSPPSTDFNADSAHWNLRSWKDIFDKILQ